MKRVKKFIPMFLILLIALSISISYAWFISNNEITVSSMENFSVKVSNSLSMSYRIDENTWSDYGTEINLKTSNLTDVTSDGTHFYYPTDLDDDDEPIFPFSEITSEDKDGYFIEVELKIKSDSKLVVYLSNNSYVKAKGSENASSVDTLKDQYKSLYGDFSSSYIAGAARVSVGEVNNNIETLKQIWIPNSTYQLTYGSDDKATFNLDGTREETYGYEYNGTDKIEMKNFDDSDYYKKIVAVGNDSLAGSGMVNSASPIVEFDGTTTEKQIVVRVWIEGTDREADAALNQGVIDYNIEFIGVVKSEEKNDAIYNLHDIINTENSATLKHSSTNNSLQASDNIQYSYNGIEWYDYSSGISDYNDGTSDHDATCVYIRNKETTTTIYNTVCKIDLVKQTNDVVYTKNQAIDVVVSNGQDGKLYYKYCENSFEALGNSQVYYSYDETEWSSYNATSGLPNYFVTNSSEKTTTRVYIKETLSSTVIYELDLENNTTKIKVGE